jgi:arabinoxylan arabinofuranohydrolase
MHARFYARHFVFSAFTAIALTSFCDAENPTIQTIFTADPAPLVHNGTVYLYTSHDEDDARAFKMIDWRLYTSTDMVNWTDHGAIASLATFPWARQNNDAWAPQVVERNKKFYLYVPISVPGEPKGVIAVAVSDKPEGPFKDALGHPLIAPASDNIDPTVFVDDDGQAYLYWGNPNLYYVKLNKDMISYSGDIVKVASKPADYQEGPWFYRRKGKYYLAYASTCCSEGIGYAMSNSPTGPWEHKGKIMDPNVASSGNHPGIIDYKGSSYVFGFNYRLNFDETPIHRERRGVSIAKFAYNKDGTIPNLPWWNTTEGVPQVGTVNPFGRVEAETIAWTCMVPAPWDHPIDWVPCIKTEKNDKVGVYVTNALNNCYIKVAGVDFGKEGAASFTSSVASASRGGKIELHVDRTDGPTIGTLNVSNTSGWQAWKQETTEISGATGVHDLFLVFKGNREDQLFNFDYWSFAKKH